MRYFIRMISGIISALVICFPLALLNTTPKSEQVTGTYYYSLAENFWVPFFAMVLIYTIIAVPYSIYVVDNIMMHHIKIQNGLINFVISALFYICGGILAYLLFMFIIGSGLDSRIFNIFSIYLSSMAGLIFKGF